MVLLRATRRPSGFIEPCRPTKAARPPFGPDWVHEIKHDGFRLLVRREAWLKTKNPMSETVRREREEDWR
jgi:ATP-dependent DNA ligase